MSDVCMHEHMQVDGVFLRTFVSFYPRAEITMHTKRKPKEPLKQYDLQCKGATVKFFMTILYITPSCQRQEV